MIPLPESSTYEEVQQIHRTTPDALQDVGLVRAIAARASVVANSFHTYAWRTASALWDCITVDIDSSVVATDIAPEARNAEATMQALV